MKALQFIILFFSLSSLSVFSDLTHKIKKGEYLGTIAKKYGVTTEALQRYNGIRNPNKVSVGQVLKIPGKKAPKPARNTATPDQNSGQVHQVSKGDTFYEIAKRYGISTEALKKANAALNMNNLSIGQKLRLPGGVKQAVAQAVTQNSAQTVNPAPQKKLYALVVTTEQMTMGEFAKNYSMSIKELNDLNGWAYDAETIFKEGSEAYIVRQH